MPEGADVTTELSHEHAEIEQLVQRVASLEAGRERTDLARAAAERFLAHAHAEERYLLPAFRRYLPGGEDEAAGQLHRAETVRHLVGRMERADGHDEKLDVFVGRIALEIQRHIEEQDTTLLPQLLDACPRAEVNTIGRQMRDAVRDERGRSEA